MVRDSAPQRGRLRRAATVYVRLGTLFGASHIAPSSMPRVKVNCRRRVQDPGRGAADQQNGRERSERKRLGSDSGVRVRAPRPGDLQLSLCSEDLTPQLRRCSGGPLNKPLHRRPDEAYRFPWVLGALTHRRTGIKRVRAGRAGMVPGTRGVRSLLVAPEGPFTWRRASSRRHFSSARGPRACEGWAPPRAGARRPGRARHRGIAGVGSSGDEPRVATSFLVDRDCLRTARTRGEGSVGVRLRSSGSASSIAAERLVAARPGDEVG